VDTVYKSLKNLTVFPKVKKLQNRPLFCAENVLKAARLGTWVRRLKLHCKMDRAVVPSLGRRVGLVVLCNKTSKDV